MILDFIGGIVIGFMLTTFFILLYDLIKNEIIRRKKARYKIIEKWIDERIDEKILKEKYKNEE